MADDHLYIRAHIIELPRKKSSVITMKFNPTFTYLGLLSSIDKSISGGLII